MMDIFGSRKNKVTFFHPKTNVGNEGNRIFAPPAGRPSPGIRTKINQPMWQRVQTLYLAISTILIGVLFFTSKAVTYDGEGGIQESFAFTAYLPYLILLIIIEALNILALTTYKHRIFQMRTAALSAIITLALQAWLVVDFVLTHDVMVFRVMALFPLFAAIFDFMAVRGILSDQMIVESANSLRKSRRDRRR